MFVLFACIATPCRTVEDYTVTFCACTLSNDTGRYIGLRTFTQDKKPKLLIVNPYDLSTRIVDRSQARCGTRPLVDLLRSVFGSCAFAKALDSAEQNESLIQNAGLTRGFGPEKGIVLTADLCPSSRPLDRHFFTVIIDRFGRVEKPVPIAIAVAGVWMHQHPQDLAWLIGLQEHGDIAVTWINHSYYHKSLADVPLKENFLLSQGTNLDVEVLKTERKMIENGITPSVFFRFPGLVSDSLLFAKITRYGLLPLGCDAWLAKNQTPKNGSIVLVHANGNEPYGIRQFFNLVNRHGDDIKAGTWLLQDIRKSISVGEP